MRKDRIKIETLVHELGHAIFMIETGCNPYIMIFDDGFSVLGKTLGYVKDAAGNELKLLLAGFAMEAIVYNKRFVMHYGTDRDKVKELKPTKEEIEMAKQELYLMLQPYAKVVKEYAEAKVESEGYNEVLIPYEEIFELVNTAKSGTNQPL